MKPTNNTARKIVNAKAVFAKGKTHRVEEIESDGVTRIFNVESGASGNTYTVEICPAGTHTCTCDWGTRGGTCVVAHCSCSHVQAAMMVIAAEDGNKVAAWSDLDSAKRQHRKFQDIGDGVFLTFRKQSA